MGNIITRCRLWGDLHLSVSVCAAQGDDGGCLFHGWHRFTA